ncbi:hypothetical protein SPSPH_045740 [Sporomusa sphaeroides DSM 2875]|uniref:Uncharacterized protein n=1 Tax=Sporomusa sphaeroides DSM 2875 TaxID=1337886 RepID=A0ABM9W2K5_9FIRM|nr:hypothetical protein SPSPH_28000 [Sporomusa sphaeroides DSM 2875]CVK18502.1 hypothetical protein SSPH_01140 [Sporomusa sphaeroides DSM 2875]
MKHIRCRCCGVSLTSGLKFYPQGDSKFVCQNCKPPILRCQEPPKVYVSTDVFTGEVPVRYAELVDIT